MANSTNIDNLMSDLNALVRAPKDKDKKLKDLPQKGGHASKVGVSTKSGARPAAGSSSYTEPDYNLRTWHDPETITSTDGFFTYEIVRLKKVILQDASGAVVSFEFANKPVEDPPPV